MSENSKIQWTDHTWNPWRGCTKVSPGCANCYAETQSKRNPKVLGQWGKGKPRVKAKNWNDPKKWNDKWERLNKDIVLDPRPMVFPSFCDWLDDEVPIEWLAQFLNLIRETPNITWQLLTKRPELFKKRLLAVDDAICSEQEGEFIESEDDRLLIKWIHEWLNGGFPHNVWLGTSVEDQERADERIPILLDTPAAVRFLSCEPLLSNIDLWDARYKTLNKEGRTGAVTEWKGHGVDWVIIGGESGPKARPCYVDWIRSIKDQCVAAQVPVFVKQLGKIPIISTGPEPTAYERSSAIKDPKGGDWDEWSEDLKLRQMPSRPNITVSGRNR